MNINQTNKFNAAENALEPSDGEQTMAVCRPSGPSSGSLHDEVTKVWSADRPILIVARNSSPMGAAAERCVDDLSHALNAIARLGVRLPELPSKAELIEQWQAAPAIRPEGAGRRVTHRFATLDYSTTHGIVVLLNTGTATRLDPDGVQPFMTRLATEIRAWKPCLVFAYRLDRLARSPWALGPAMLELSSPQMDGWLGDCDYVVQASDTKSLEVLFSVRITHCRCSGGRGRA